MKYGASHNHDPDPTSVCVTKANLKSLVAQTRDKPGHLFAQTTPGLARYRQEDDT